MPPLETSRKRAYQPSIAAFFPRATQPNHNCTRTANTAFAQTQSSLPAHIQSSLLNVGMRVRKAVPGGYQTHKIESLPRVGSARGAITYSRPRELVPCAWGYDATIEQKDSAIHEVGGWSVQQAKFNVLDMEDDTPPSSWESQASTDSMSEKTGNKRSLEEDDENEENEDPEHITTELHHGEVGNDARSRPFARPRASLARRLGLSSTVSTRQSEENDFEDAAFLKAREEVMDWAFP